MTDKQPDWMTKAGRRIAKPAGGGSINYGEDIAIILKMADGTQEHLECTAAMLPQVIDLLRSFGQMAANDRAKRPGGVNLDEIVQPYRSRSTPRIGRAPDGWMALRFDTDSGIPVTVAMPPEQARELGKGIGKEMAKPPPKIGQH